jgi:hypothetical protein
MRTRLDFLIFFCLDGLHFYIYSTTEQPTIYWRRDTTIQYYKEDESLLYD